MDEAWALGRRRVACPFPTEAPVAGSRGRLRAVGGLHGVPAPGLSPPHPSVTALRGSVQVEDFRLWDQFLSFSFFCELTTVPPAVFPAEPVLGVPGTTC